MFEFEPDNSNPESDCFEASKEEQRKHFEKLWEMVVKYSELAESTPDERLRMGNLRQRVALVSRVLGMMDRATLNAELGRHAGIVANAMGCQAFVVVKTDNTRH
jgi:hypothetical protein